MQKKDITNEIALDEEYLNIVSPILFSSEFQKRKKWKHHESCSLYEHCLAVSYLAYKICKKKKLNYNDAAIGGLLHDFYYRPWQEHLDEKVPLFSQHGFVHAREAMENSYRFYPEMMNDRISNIIERHMFPLNIIPPKYREGWIVNYADKRLSMDVVINIKALPKYLGLSRYINKVKKVIKRK